MSATVLLKSVDIEIPGYRILRPIGEGGMASVFLAVQESLDREVALKVMAPALSANAEFTDRFVKEGRITAKLSHPNLVTVFDIGAHGGVNYLAAEYIPGGTLREKVGEGMSIAEALDVAVDVARGLHYAHDKGFVHRDVKPGNILFKSDGTAVLADFGIAKAINAKSGATMAGASIGTPDYMSPEQARAEQVDGRSDMYSLGAVLYEMLTGSPPYSASDPFTVALMHVTQPVPQLPQKLAWLQPLVDGLMAKQPESRIGTGEDFIHQVETLLAAAPEAETIHSAATPRRRGTHRISLTPTTPGRAVPSGRGRRWLFPGVAAALLVVVALLGWIYWPAGESAADPSASQVAMTPEQGPSSVPLRAVELPKPVDGPDSEVPMLLTRADAYLKYGTEEEATRKLVFPDDDSALGLYRRVLELDPGNEQAQEGLQRIADFYLARARALCERQLWSVCANLAIDGLKADPDSAELKALLGEAQQGARGG